MKTSLEKAKEKLKSMSDEEVLEGLHHSGLPRSTQPITQKELWEKLNKEIPETGFYFTITDTDICEKIDDPILHRLIKQFQNAELELDNYIIGKLRKQGIKPWFEL